MAGKTPAVPFHTAGPAAASSAPAPNFLPKVIAWLTVHRQCAWCRRWLHVAPLTMFAQDRRAWTTHGICPACAAKMLAEAENFNARVAGCRSSAV